MCSVTYELRTAINSSCAVSTELLPALAADLKARRVRAKARRRTRSAAMEPRRTAAGVAAPRARRAGKTERRARRMTPGLGPALAPGPAPDRALRIAPGSRCPRAAIHPRATTRRASPSGAPAPVHARPTTPNPERGPNLSPSPSLAPPPQPKPAPTPVPPPVQSLAPNLAPRLAHAPVPAHSSDLGLSVISPGPTVFHSPITFPRKIPCLPFLNISCRRSGHSLDVCDYAPPPPPFHLAFTLQYFFFIRNVLYGGVFVK